MFFSYVKKKKKKRKFYPIHSTNWTNGVKKIYLPSYKCSHWVRLAAVLVLHCGSIPERRCLGNFYLFFLSYEKTEGTKELSKWSCCTVQDGGSYHGYHRTVFRHLCGEVVPCDLIWLSALPPFNPLWGNVKLKKKKNKLQKSIWVIFAPLYSLHQPQ